MIYQETYQTGVDPNQQNLSAVIYDQRSNPVSERKGFPPHSHSFYEMDYTIDGTAEFEFENRIVTVRAGSFIFYSPLTVHSIKRDSRNFNLIIQFSSRLLQDNLPGFCDNQLLLTDGSLRENGSLVIPSQPENTLRRIINRLVSTVPTLTIPHPANIAELTAFTPAEWMDQISLILGLLSQLIRQGNLQVANAPYNTSDLSRMHLLISRMIEHPEEKISMDQAAAFVNMSYSNFCRTFKNAVGYSYVDFNNIQRIERAKELLSHTNLSVTEISMHLNFGSISYFNRIFKKFTGFTPLSYRLYFR